MIRGNTGMQDEQGSFGSIKMLNNIFMNECKRLCISAKLCQKVCPSTICYKANFSRIFYEKGSVPDILVKFF